MPPHGQHVDSSARSRATHGAINAFCANVDSASQPKSLAEIHLPRTECFRICYIYVAIVEQNTTVAAGRFTLCPRNLGYNFAVRISFQNQLAGTFFAHYLPIFCQNFDSSVLLMSFYTHFGRQCTSPKDQHAERHHFSRHFKIIST